MSAYNLPEATSYTTTRVWSLGGADRVLLTETHPAVPKGRLRQFAAHHVAVTWDQDGNVVKAHTAGVEQRDGRDSYGFVGETWRADPPVELAAFLAYPAAVAL